MRREYTPRMRPPSLLLHVLLSLALVANGLGTAMASVHAGCAHATVASATATAEPPCHDGMGAMDSRAHDGNHDRGAHTDGLSPAPSSASHDDGCGSSCACGCIAHGMAALMPPMLLLPVSTGIAYAPTTTRTHATPTLPHPVRPPIG